jgi:signal transduction histidine kinase
MAARRGGTSSEERLRKLQSVTDAALSHLLLDDLFDELLERIRDALEADTSAILLLDEERGELVARAAKGLEEEVERGVRIPVGEGFAGRIAAEQRPVALGEIDHTNVLNPILREKGIKSLLGAPLLARGRVLGVVHVGTLVRRRFGADDVELLQLAAERAAIALEHALVHEELLMLDAIKREFVATAAHEIRAPTTIIYGIAKTLADRDEVLDRTTRDDLIAALYDSTDRLARLTDDLLDFSRLETAQPDVAAEPLRLRRLVEELSLGLSARPRHEIAIEIPDDLVLVSNRNALERILGNLVRNSFVHGAPPVTIRAFQAEEGARISVEDRGPGISPGFATRLFDPFARANDATGKPGAGLGLAIARSYARKLGGDVFYEQAQPRGARFTVVLPAGPGSYATAV